MTKLHPILTTISSHLKVKRSHTNNHCKRWSQKFSARARFFPQLVSKKCDVWWCVVLWNLSWIIASVAFTGVETLEWPWFCHRREHFLLIIVSEVGQTYQQNGLKLRAEVSSSATIFCKHFDMVSKLMRYKNARVVFNFPSSLHKVVSSSKYRVQSILCTKTFV